MATTPARRSMLIGFLGTLVLGLLVLIGASVAIAARADGLIHAGVSVGGIDLAGLTRSEAESRLVSGLPALDDGTATVSAGEAEASATFAELGRGYELDAMLDAAFGVGRGDAPIADAITRLRTLFHDSSLPVIVHAYDDDALAAVADRLASGVSTEPVEAFVDPATFEVSEGRDGRSLPAADVREALAPLLASTSPADIRVALEPDVVPPLVSTEEARAAARAAHAIVAGVDLTIPGAADGDEPLVVSAGQIAGWITFGPEGDADYVATVDATAVRTMMGDLAAKVDRDPVDARITVAGTSLNGVVPAQDGRVLQVAPSADALLAALEDRAGGASVTSLALSVQVTEPALTTAEAQEILPQMRLVSSWTTYYVPGDGNGYGNNISIGAWDLDGYNIAPGEWFSFWNGIGPVTVERGYRYGGAIINGRSVANGALAGGICSTSTTLFNAAMRFGLEIGDRTAHYYYIDRYPTGLDATVAIVDSSVTDMTFRNDTDHPIVIRGYGSPGQVTFQLWSVPNGRTVALSNPVITDRRAAIETTQLDTSMAPGTARRVEYPHNGFKVTVSRTVTGPDGTVLHQNTWFSDYRTVNGITLVGPTPAPVAAPDPPEEPTPPDDEA